MQDGARPHHTAEVLDILQATFKDQIIALDILAFTGHGVEWPPYSPELNPCDFLRGYLKDRVFKDAPAALQDLCTAISREIRPSKMMFFSKSLRNSVQGYTHSLLQKESTENLLH